MTIVTKYPLHRYSDVMTNTGASESGAVVPWNVRAELARRGVRQVEAAEVLGITQPSLSNRLCGRVQFTVHELVQLAEWLDVSPAHFFAPFECQAVPSEQASS
ncbi:MAG: helix-turn-helix transcriptional regulator [Brooklawnia sp.]|nr:helix-turn-helix transcriptional regulator [Brooklawnia sp.]